MSIALDVQPRTTTIEQQLADLGAVVHHITYGANHRFGWCEQCGDLDATASCNVYGISDETYREVCTGCVVSVVDDVLARFTGRWDEVTVEIGTVEAPKPTAISVPAPRPHDLADLMPLPCDTCAPARGSIATVEIGFDVTRHGRPDPVRWHVCLACLDSCWAAAEAQHDTFTPVTLTRLADLNRSAA